VQKSAAAVVWCVGGVVLLLLLGLLLSQEITWSVLFVLYRPLHVVTRISSPALFRM
jgi:hypothetical protein